ncbi:MAG: hypothetical protein ACLQKA_04955 [Bryobacteraceae bacterium]
MGLLADLYDRLRGVSGWATSRLDGMGHDERWAPRARSSPTFRAPVQTNQCALPPPKASGTDAADARVQ